MVNLSTCAKEVHSSANIDPVHQTALLKQGSSKVLQDSKARLVTHFGS